MAASELKSNIIYTYLKDALKTYFFANVICCSRLQLWVGCFIYFKFTHVFFYLMSLVQLEKRLRSKGICALLFDGLNWSFIVQLQK